MQIQLKPGKYVIAVSGGVDSMVLLDMLRKKSGIELVVSHINHGIRPDADEDEALVASYATSHNITYEAAHLHLGQNASEEIARNARYKFLRQCRKKYGAVAIITAHHQDDMIETAIINILRGTGWRGLAPFALYGDIVRPLLQHTKKQLVAYAVQHGLLWREDSSNADQTYLRNYVRHSIIPACTARDKNWKDDFLRYIRSQQILCRTIQEMSDELLKTLVVIKNGTATVRRYNVIMLPRFVAYEFLQALFKAHCGNSRERRQVEAILVFAKVAGRGKLMPINTQWQCRTTQDSFIVEPRSPVIS